MATRRDFIKNTGIIAAGLGLSSFKGLPGAESYRRIAGAGGRINLACIGAGNRGASIIKEFEQTGLANIVALCDVDMGAKHTRQIMGDFPKAKLF
jgi:hypothetical protein